MRLFAALPLADDVVATIEAATADHRRRHRDLAWTPPASWHVTLAFLGTVGPDRVDDAAAVLHHAAAGRGGIELRLDAPGRFGQRVAWLAVADRPAGAVAALGEGLQAALADAGMPVDRRPVRPHVTLARARGRRGRLPPTLVDGLPRLDATWRVTTATLYRSHLGAGPVRYEPLASAPLGGPS